MVESVSAQHALARLREGNARFVGDQIEGRRRDSSRREVLAEGQRHLLGLFGGQDKE